ncbi:MAG: hotdog fold thioesterase [Bacteroidales bacterium]|nr:hotdog fold thioesterase [Bacteroidales bacterium]
MDIKEFLSEGDRFARGIGARLEEVRPGYSRASLTVEERHLNAGGVCQGGVIFTLADLTFASIVNASAFLTPLIGGTIYYHRSARLGDTLTAEGRVLSDHHKLPCAVVEVRTQDGTHIATFTGEGYATRTVIKALEDPSNTFLEA